MGSPPTTTPPATPEAQGQADREGLAFQAEHSLIGNRAVTFLTTRVPPPAALYVTADDGLYVQVINVQVGVTVVIAATLLLPDGRVQASSWSLNPTSDGVVNTRLFPLAECYLLNCTVTPQPTTRHGATWIYVAVRRGGIAGGVNLQNLLSGYVDALIGPTWPGSELRNALDGRGLLITFSFPGPMTGTVFTYAFASYAQILLRSVYAKYSASAQVANRNVILTLFDASSNLIWQDVTEASLAASSTGSVSWGLELGTGDQAFTLNNMSRSLPAIYLPPGSTLQFSAANMQSSDQIGPVYVTYEQWFSA